MMGKRAYQSRFALRARRLRRRPACELIERRVVLSSFTVTSTADSTAANTLRWAIEQVNAGTGPGSISFNIPGGGVQVIALEQPLPAITNPVVIDGTTQPTYSGSPMIQIDAPLVRTAGADGLVLSAASNTIAGLSIVGFSGSGIVLNPGANATEVVADYIGWSAAGGQARPNGTGISINGASNNTIGGTIAGSGNVISGNTGDGILMNTGGGAGSDNDIYGNLIGTDPTGTFADANGESGIDVEGAPGTQIGLPVTNAGNVISGNTGPGIELLSGATGTVIQNNEIGFALDGKSAIGNGGDGIYLSDSPWNQIGGTLQIDANLIGSNGGNGINAQGSSSNTLVEGNFIGTDVTATLNRGNQSNGIELGSSSNTIGGTIAGAANTIDFNGAGQAGSGVQLVGSPTFNEILSNSIYENSVLGINLGNGPTPSHQPGTPGPNNYQNYPTLLAAQGDGTTTIVQGKLIGLPSTNYLIQFYSSVTASASGFGEGQTLIGSDVVPSDANGLVTFTYPMSADTAPGEWISATATDPAGDTSEFALDEQVQGQINLVLTGAASPTPVASGGQVTYSLTVRNQGTISATDVVLNNQLPGGLGVVSAIPSQGYVQPLVGSSQIADLQTIAPGGMATLTVVAQTDSNTPLGTIVDNASVTSDQVDPTPADESVVIDDTVATSADLSVQLTANDTTVLAATNLTYTITATNNGPQAANNVSVTLPIVSGEAFVSSNAASASEVNGQVVIDLGNLAVNAKASVQVVVEALTAGTLSETATVTSDSVDPDPSNNTSTVNIQVNPAALLQVTLASSESPVVLGNDFDYVVTLFNAGPNDATGVVFIDTHPGEVQFVSASDDQNVTAVYSAGVVSLSLGTLQLGATAKLSIEVAPQGAPGSSLIDSASATEQVGDPDPDDGSATLVTPVIGVSDLLITATSQQSSVYVGQNIEYLLSVSNHGPYDEPDAVVSWPVPTDATFVSAECPQGSGTSVAQGTVSVIVGAVGSGDTVDLSMVVTPLAGAAGTFTTTFSVQGENLDPDTSNNGATVSVQVVPSSDLAVTINPGQIGPYDDASWSYTETVENLGPSDATGVVLSSPLPGDVSLTSATPSQGPAVSIQNGVATASLGAIGAGQSATVTFVVLPTSVAPIDLTASVAGDQYDPSLGNNEASLAVSTSPSDSLLVSVVSQATTVTSGQSWSFTAWVQNAGPDPATNVVMTIPLSGGLVLSSALPSQGTSSSSGTAVTAALGQIEPGSSASVQMVVMTTTAGTISQTASVTSSQNQLDLDGLSGSTNVNVLASPGILQFAAASYSVADDAGSAELVVTRTGGARGAVTVGYQTVSAGATPGLDYVPTSGTLSFAAGATSATISVPVLADQWVNKNQYVNVVISSPTGGASIGPQGTTLLQIVDLDPNFTPPEVSSLTWTGTSRSITSLAVGFSQPLDPKYAMLQGDYQLVAPGLGNIVIPLTPQSYNSSSFSVTLVPSIALPSGQYYYIQIVGTGPNAIRDIAGNLLDGAGSGQPGSNYEASFAQGTQLKYVDGSGNKVSLKLTGSGYLEQVRNSSDEGVVLDVVGMKPYHATLSGTVGAPVSRAAQKHKSARTTELGTIEGLGNFGDVKVLLTSPPFLVKSYPFQRRGKGVL